MPRDIPRPGPHSAGVVASASPQASAAGARILARGGNAIDAAIAVSLNLGVTELAGSGIGGQAMMLVARPNATPFAIEGASLAPRGIPDGVSDADLTGRCATTVPTLLRTLAYAFEHHGSTAVTWEELVAPAIESARGGFTLGRFGAMVYARCGEALQRDPATAASVGIDGRAPCCGDVVVLEALGRTLEHIARRGADDFYEGELARAIAADMQEQQGWVDAADLAAVPTPTVSAALRGEVGEFEVYSLPPPGSGWAVILALQILSRAETKIDAPGGVVRLGQAMGAAQRVRLSHPLPALQDASAAVAAKIDPAFAARLATRLRPQERGETTHFSVVDRHGTMVGVTQSLNALFGAKVAHPTLGFLYNNYMLDFQLGQASVSNSLKPGAKPYSYMAATALYRDGRPRLMVGSAGDDRIITSTIQVAARWADSGRGIADAVAAPRIHPLGRSEIMAEAGAVQDADIREFERMGITVMQPVPHFAQGPLQPYFGGVHAVAEEDGVFAGGVDPRRDGAVAVE